MLAKNTDPTIQHDLRFRHKVQACGETLGPGDDQSYLKSDLDWYVRCPYRSGDAVI